MDHFIATISGRLDKILAQKLDVSRNQVEKLVKEGWSRLTVRALQKQVSRSQKMMR